MRLYGPPDAVKNYGEIRDFWHAQARCGWMAQTVDDATLLNFPELEWFDRKARPEDHHPAVVPGDTLRITRTFRKATSYGRRKT